MYHEILQKSRKTQLICSLYEDVYKRQHPQKSPAFAAAKDIPRNIIYTGQR